MFHEKKKYDVLLICNCHMLWTRVGESHPEKRCHGSGQWEHEGLRGNSASELGRCGQI